MDLSFGQKVGWGLADMGVVVFVIIKQLLLLSFMTAYLGVAFDIALNYKLKYQSKIIENITIGLGVFHPAATSSEKYFLPTYSIDFRFK